MLLLGLTGSIATGKSTVSTLLHAAPYNLPIIDADILARVVVAPGTPGYRAIIKHFLPSTPDLLLAVSEEEKRKPGFKGAPLNRPVLGRRVFGDSEERKRDRGVLNAIVHPRVRWEMYKSLLYYYLSGQWAVVLDIPLLFESGLDVLCGTVLVVACTPEVQMERLRNRDPHLSVSEARDRVESQGDVRGKAERCVARGEGRGVVVCNDGGREELEREIERVMREIRERSPRWWAWLLLLCPPLAGLSGVWNYYRGVVINRRWKESQFREKAKL